MRFTSRKQWRWYVFFALFIAALQFTGAARPIQRIGTTALNPLIASAFAQTERVRKWWLFIGSERQRAERIGELQGEYDVMKTRVAILDAENISLRRALQFANKAGFTSIGADVISRTMQADEQSLVVNRGLHDGVQRDAIVIADNGVLIGRIAEVRDSVSVVRLLSDVQSRVPAMMIGGARAIGVVEGVYGASLVMNLIPQQEVIQIGDLVATADINSAIPSGLLIGSVAAVRRENYEPFQHATIISTIPYQHVSAVLIVMSGL